MFSQGFLHVWLDLSRWNAQGNIKNQFVIYYSYKDNANFPNLQRDKQINHNIKISFNFIDYSVYGAFCICQFGPAFLS